MCFSLQVAVNDKLTPGTDNRLLIVTGDQQFVVNLVPGILPKVNDPAKVRTFHSLKEFGKSLEIYICYN